MKQRLMKSIGGVLSMVAFLLAGVWASAQTPQSNQGAVTDPEKHQQEKAAWIKAHPEEYRQMGGNPNEVGEPSELQAAETKAVLPAFVSEKTFVLTQAVAVAAPGAKISAAELENENQALKEDFPVNVLRLHLGSNNQRQLTGPKGMDLRFTEIREGNDVAWKFLTPDCESCNKNLILKVEQETASSVVYQLMSEDENAPVQYKLTFNLQ